MPSIDEERQRVLQDNDIAGVVIDQAKLAYGDHVFVLLDFRYGIADALWAAGYRKVAT